MSKLRSHFASHKQCLEEFMPPITTFIIQLCQNDGASIFAPTAILPPPPASRCGGWWCNPSCYREIYSPSFFVVRPTSLASGGFRLIRCITFCSSVSEGDLYPPGVDGRPVVVVVSKCHINDRSIRASDEFIERLRTTSITAERLHSWLKKEDWHERMPKKCNRDWNWCSFWFNREDNKDVDIQWHAIDVPVFEFGFVRQSTD